MPRGKGWGIKGEKFKQSLPQKPEVQEQTGKKNRKGIQPPPQKNQQT